MDVQVASEDTSPSLTKPTPSHFSAVETLALEVRGMGLPSLSVEEFGAGTRRKVSAGNANEESLYDSVQKSKRNLRLFVLTRICGPLHGPGRVVSP